MKKITLEEIKTQLIVDSTNNNTSMIKLDSIDVLEGYGYLEKACNSLEFFNLAYSIEMYDNGHLEGYHTITIRIKEKYNICFCYEDLYNVCRMENLKTNVNNFIGALIF